MCTQSQAEAGANGLLGFTLPLSLPIDCTFCLPSSVLCVSKKQQRVRKAREGGKNAHEGDFKVTATRSSDYSALKAGKGFCSAKRGSEWWITRKAEDTTLQAEVLQGL